jgi:hypothetical protein
LAPVYNYFKDTPEYYNFKFYFKYKKNLIFNNNQNKFLIIKAT